VRGSVTLRAPPKQSRIFFTHESSAAPPCATSAVQALPRQPTNNLDLTVKIPRRDTLQSFEHPCDVSSRKVLESTDLSVGDSAIKSFEI
jgi:hypothetical protein